MEIRNTWLIGSFKILSQRLSRCTIICLIICLIAGATFSCSTTPSSVPASESEASLSPSLPPIQGPAFNEFFPKTHLPIDRSALVIALLPTQRTDQWLGYLGALKTLRENKIPIQSILTCGISIPAKHFFENTSTAPELDWLFSQFKGSRVWALAEWMEFYHKNKTLNSKTPSLQSHFESNDQCLKADFKLLLSQELWKQDYPVILLGYRASAYDSKVDFFYHIPPIKDSSSRFEKIKSEALYLGKQTTIPNLSKIKSLLKP